MIRTPARDDYDAFVELFPWGGVPALAYGVVKISYTFDADGVRRSAAQPLRHDIRKVAQRRSYLRGTDYLPYKHAADIVVLGNAYARSDDELWRDVSVSVGGVSKELRVFGTRAMRRRTGYAPRIEYVDPLEVVPLTREEAYGGGAHAAASGRNDGALINLTYASASGDGAVYPRNPYGKGYWALDSADELVTLPRVEDPSDLLTVERIFGQYEHPWTELPLPWHLDWMGIDQFPRFPAPFGDAFGAAQDLLEVRRGLWSAEWIDSSKLEAFFREGALLQEASLGMVWRNGEEGAPVRIVGMHPDQDLLEFRLPPPPMLEIEIEGSRSQVRTRLTNLVIAPHERTFTMTWSAVQGELPRKFVPGVHGHIPLRLYVDGGAPIDYETPPPVYQRRRRVHDGHGAAGAGAREKNPVELFDDFLASGSPVRDRDQIPLQALDLLAGMDIPSGRLLLAESDWQLVGAGFPFSISRHYCSSRAWRVGVLGPGWTHSLEQAVWVEDGHLLYRTPDGRELYVAGLRSGELGLGKSVHHPHEGVSVRRVASDGYELLRSDGWRLSLTEIPRTIQRGPVEARVTRLTSRFGVAAEILYDSHGQLARVTLPAGAELRFEHNRGRLVTVRAPTADGSDYAVIARYDYDVAGQLVGTLDAAGHTTHYKYSNRLLVESISHDGEVRRYAYDDTSVKARVRAVTRVDDGQRCELLFSDQASVAIDFTGSARAVHVDSGGRPVIARDAHGHEAHRSYDESTRLCTGETDRLGRKTEYLYDAAGHLAEVSEPDGTRHVIDCDSFGHLRSRSDPDGFTESFGWDLHGRLHAAVTADGSSTLCEHDDAGRLAALITPGEGRVEIDRDPRGAIRGLRSPLGERRVTCDALGRVRKVVDEEGHSTRLRYDANGQVRSLAFGGEARIESTRGPSGGITHVSDGESELSLERDKRGNLVTLRCGGEEMVVLHRDPAGRVTLVQSPTLELHELRYDTRGSLVEESAADDSITRYEYDAEERLCTVKRPGRITSCYEYDVRGRLIAARHGETEERFEYSAGGQLRTAIASTGVVELERDGVGRIRSEVAISQGRSSKLASRYDARGDRVELESGFLDGRLRVERGLNGAPIAVRLVGEHSMFELCIRSDRRGCELQRDLPGGLALSLDRDALGRIVRRRVVRGDRVLSETKYRWATIQRLRAMFDSVDGEITMEHDARGHLVALRRGNAKRIRPVDVVGNIYRVPERDDHRYGPAGRLLEAYGISYRYDAAGRRVEKETPDGSITRYRWEGPDRLAEVELPEARRVRYAYDALGRLIRRRVERRDNAGWLLERERCYVWDGLTLLHEIEGEDATGWIWLDGRLVATVQQGYRATVLTDPLGVVREIVSESGELSWRGGVDMFGAGWRDVSGMRQPWRWPGHIEDEETGLSMSLMRVYDPEAAQYLSPCPLGIAAGPNHYCYVRDPLSETSPLGMGPGLDPHFGAEIPECAHALHVKLLRSALDRFDGSAGAPTRFEPDSLLRDPQELMLGQWARLTRHLLEGSWLG